MEETSIWVSQHQDNAYVRVKGKGTFQNAHFAKQFVGGMLKKGSHHFVFDLALCTYMDSTFMGMLAGVASMTKENHGDLMIVNPNTRILELLQNLGLDQVLTIRQEPVELTTSRFSPVQGEGQTKTEVSKIMLESHENLVAVDERNALKFQDVLTFLREKLDAQET